MAKSKKGSEEKGTKEKKAAPEKTGEEKAQKEKKPSKKIDPNKEVYPKSSKANPKNDINPHTGTRFAPNSARQVAFKVVFDGAKAGKAAKEIREDLAKQRKENGCKFNLDKGYLNFVVASHPEFFKVYQGGRIEIIGEPKPDKEAAKKLDEAQAEKRKKAAEARAARKKEEGGDEGKKSKKEKKEKKAKKEEASADAE